ncbi:DivIVA domain-containing protein [Actinotalea sp.]|uniref:DivIVA domain-containing protein n=1 Tax=Actinotalea sp. TaxID=1872145 RepID=UPI00356A44A3
MTTMFRTTGRLSMGYDPGQVDEFFVHARRVYEGEVTDAIDGRTVRRAAFDLVRHGYQPTAVDAALDRLEHAFVSRERTAFVATHGQQAWLEHLAERARTLYGRLARPDGERFAPAPRRSPGYDPDEVDEVCRRLVDYFDNGHALSSAEIRQVTFTRRKGHDGYAEGPVDAFLERAVEVLLGVE